MKRQTISNPKKVKVGPAVIILSLLSLLFWAASFLAAREAYLVSKINSPDTLPLYFGSALFAVFAILNLAIVGAVRKAARKADSTLASASKPDQPHEN